jgi:hypothetical protein
MGARNDRLCYGAFLNITIDSIESLPSSCGHSGNSPEGSVFYIAYRVPNYWLEIQIELALFAGSPHCVCSYDGAASVPLLTCDGKNGG